MDLETSRESVRLDSVSPLGAHPYAPSLSPLDRVTLHAVARSCLSFIETGARRNAYNGHGFEVFQLKNGPKEWRKYLAAKAPRQGTRDRENS